MRYAIALAIVLCIVMPAVADDYMQKYIIDELASKAEYEAEDLAERQLQEELDHAA